MNNSQFNLLELAAMYDALIDRIHHLESHFDIVNDVQNRAEYEVSKSALEKVRGLYLSGGGPKGPLK